MTTTLIQATIEIETSSIVAVVIVYDICILLGVWTVQCSYCSTGEVSRPWCLLVSFSIEVFEFLWFFRWNCVLNGSLRGLETAALNFLQVCTGHCDMCKPFCVLTDCRVQVLMSFVRPRTVGLCLSSNEIPERTILTVLLSVFFVFTELYYYYMRFNCQHWLSLSVTGLRYGTVNNKSSKLLS